MSSICNHLGLLTLLEQPLEIVGAPGRIRTSNYTGFKPAAYAVLLRGRATSYNDRKA